MGPNGEKRTWWLAGGIAGLVLGVMVLLLSLHRAPVRPESTKGVATPQTQIGLTRLQQTGGDNLVAEEARFFDPTPLFLPTEWNADQKMLPSSILRQPGQMFRDFSPQVFFQTNDLSLHFPATVNLPKRPGDALTVMDTAEPFYGFGRKDLVVPALAARGGYVEVVAVSSGRQVWAESLTQARPPSDNWRPLELLAVINAAGLVGQLSFIERSGADDVDAYFQNYLVQAIHLGHRLRPGFYRICVGP